MATSVTLRQEKTILTGGASDLYRVVSWVTDADPVGMYPVFKVAKGVSDWIEIYQGVVGLEDLTKYVENPLQVLQGAGINEFAAIGTTPGDTLEITNAAAIAPEWFDTYFTSADFLVEEVPGSAVTINPGKPFPTALNELEWEVRDPGGTPRGNGANAYTHRIDLDATTYLRRHWTSVLDSVAAGESRATAIEAFVESLVEAAKTHDISFQGVQTTVYE